MGPSARTPGAQRATGRDLRWQLTVAAVVAVLGLGLLLAVPALRPVLDEIAAADPGWVLAAIALELASCASFVVIYRRFFDRIARAPARVLAWTSMAAGVVLPAGGVGGLLFAGSLVRIMGHDTGWVIRRSSALFVLTSAVSVVTLVAAGGLALGGLGGPRDVLHAGIPALAGCAVIALVAALARQLPPAPQEDGGATRRSELLVGAGEAGAALLAPSWRLAGAAGYLWFDIAALWATFNAIGATPPLPALVLAYVIGYLANGLPVPGGVGVLDAGLVGALTFYGVDAVHAAAAVLVYHAVALWVPGIGGLVAFATGHQRLQPARWRYRVDDPEVG